jgi:cysteine desulfurase
VPAIVPVLLPGPPAEVWQHHLETRGVQTSVGAACQSKRGGVSATLAALGLDEEDGKRVLRVSFSRLTTEAELDAGLDALAAVAEELRAHA